MGSMMLARTVRSITRVAGRRTQIPSLVLTRGLKGGDKFESDEDLKNDTTIPFGISKWLGEKSDHLIPTDKQHDTRPKHMPEFFPEDVKREMKELGLDGIEDLDELEQKNIEGY